MTDEFRTAEEQRQYEIDFERRFKNVCRSVWGKTIALNNSMSAADINALINAQHRHIPRNQILLFQITDNTYNLNAALIFRGFYGGGQLIVQGNDGDDTLSTTKSVFLDVTGANGIEISNSCQTLVRYIKIRTSGHYSVYVNDQSKSAEVVACYNLGKSATDAVGVFAYKSPTVKVADTYFGLSKYGISSDLSRVFSDGSNDDNGVGDEPQWGLFATNAATIGKGTGGTTIHGSVANELTSHGGVIR